MNLLDSLLMANARFYEAFESTNLDVFDEVWSHQPYVKCIHPGWPVQTGWTAVRASWETVFSSNVRMKFSLRNIQAEVYGDLGVVTLTEETMLRGAGPTTVNPLSATNLFKLEKGEWRMIHHHSSPVVTGEDDPTYLYN